MSRERKKTGSLAKGVTPRSILVLAQPLAETDELLSVLHARTDLRLFRVATLDAASEALRSISIDLVLVCPETTADTISELLNVISQIRPKTPSLAFRPNTAEIPPDWNEKPIAILRWPVLSGVLSRTLDVALELRTTE